MSKYPPKASILDSIVNDNLSISVALSELIDNAIDANATHIAITVGPSDKGHPKHIVIQDNGDGCATLSDLVQLGSHVEHKRQGFVSLGRYGIGAKNAMLWLAGTHSRAIIASVHGGMHRNLEHDWHEYATNAWEIPDGWYEERPALAGETGTTVTISPCIRRFPEGKKLETLEHDLGYIYSWAIKNNVQIEIRRAGRGGRFDVRPLKRWEFPEFAGAPIDQEILVGGRGVRVYAGIVKQGVPNPKPGLTYVHSFRVIKPACGLGCGGRDFSGITGFVGLDEKWRLTKNKDGISQHQDELADAVFSVVRPLLDEAAKRGHSLALEQLEEAVSLDVRGMIDTVIAPNQKAKRRSPDNEIGAVEPVGSGRKHKRAERTQDGETFAGAKRAKLASKLSVRFQDLGDDERLGAYSDGLVILNDRHPWIAPLKAGGAMSASRPAIVLLASLLAISGLQAESAEGQRRFRFQSSGDVVSDLGLLLRGSVSLDGSIAEAAE